MLTLLFTPDDIYDKAVPAVCEIFGEDTASGLKWQAFFIDPRGYLLTANSPHLSRPFYCYWEDQEGCLEILEGRLVSSNPQYGIALIKVNCRQEREISFLEIAFSPPNPYFSQTLETSWARCCVRLLQKCSRTLSN